MSREVDGGFGSSPARRVLLLLAGIVPLLSGCGGIERSATVSATPRLVRGYSHATALVAPRVAATLRRIERGYYAGDWSLVSAAFASPDLARPYVDLLRGWKNDTGGDLRVSLVYNRPLSATRSIGTVRFSGDPRTLPTYSVFVFTRDGGRTVISGVDAGLTGDSFRTVNWVVSRTRHFVVYHSPYQLAGSDRQGLQDMEHQRADFIRRFKVRLPPVAVYYLYPDQKLIGPLTGGMCGETPDNVGCTVPDTQPPSIHASEWVSYQELIHVYQTVMSPKGYSAPLFIGEGMAVALEDRNADPNTSDYCSELAYIPLDTCAQVAAGSARPMEMLTDDGFSHADPGYAYAVAGSFVKYLIETYGDRRFVRFYWVLSAQPKDTVNDYNVATRRVYGQSIQVLLSSWQTALCRGGCG